MVWLVTGATGLLGANVALDVAAAGMPVLGIARSTPEAAPVGFRAANLMDRLARRDLIESTQASVVVHCAAMASHELCEAHPDSAEELNVHASADLAAQAFGAGAKFVYISTDAVFDGVRGGYSELDSTNPTSVYGRTKLAGERAVLAANPDALVLRVNFYGWSPSGKRSLAEFFWNAFESGRGVFGFSDVTVSTMYVGHLTQRIIGLVKEDARGVFHVTNDEAITKLDFARLVATVAGFDTELITPKLSTDVLQLARGANLSLDTSKVRAVLGDFYSQFDGVTALVADATADRRRLVREFATSA